MTAVPVGDIQPHVLKGHRSKLQAMLLLSMSKSEEPELAKLHKLVIEDKEEGALALTYEGSEKLQGPKAIGYGGYKKKEPFRRGARQATQRIGDPSLWNARWRFGSSSRGLPDIVVVLGRQDWSTLCKICTEISNLRGFTALYVSYSQPKPALGFRDGVQGAHIEGQTRTGVSEEFLPAKLFVNYPDYPALILEDKRTRREAWADFASFLVVREYDLDHGAFARISRRLGNGHNDENAQAKTMGRWKSGHDIVNHPAQPIPRNAPLEELQAEGCPRYAHARCMKLDGRPYPIFRRSFTTETGLMFASYQAELSQFEGVLSRAISGLAPDGLLGGRTAESARTYGNGDGAMFNDEAIAECVGMVYAIAPRLSVLRDWFRVGRK